MMNDNKFDNGFDLSSYHGDQCEEPYCNCDSRRYGGKSYDGSGVVAAICIGLALIASIIFQRLDFSSSDCILARSLLFRYCISNTGDSVHHLLGICNCWISLRSTYRT